MFAASKSGQLRRGRFSKSKSNASDSSTDQQIPVISSTVTLKISEPERSSESSQSEYFDASPDSAVSRNSLCLAIKEGQELNEDEMAKLRAGGSKTPTGRKLPPLFKTRMRVKSASQVLGFFPSLSSPTTPRDKPLTVDVTCPCLLQKENKFFSKSSKKIKVPAQHNGPCAFKKDGNEYHIRSNSASPHVSTDIISQPVSPSSPSPLNINFTRKHRSSTGSSSASSPTAAMKKSSMGFRYSPNLLAAENAAKIDHPTVFDFEHWHQDLSKRVFIFYVN